MYGWTDPIDPEGAPRRPEPPTDEPPAWLTDRPEPRSSYLFGDEPEQPPSRHPGPHPAGTPDRTGQLPAVDPARAGWPPAVARTGGAFDPVTHPGAPIAPFERAAGWQPTEQHTAAWQPVTDTPEEDDGSGRHRQRRRIPRPFLIGGAAAAATLVVSLGAGALLLPGDDRPTDRTADVAAAGAPAAPDTRAAPGGALAPLSPAAAPTSARPSPSRSVTPKPSRTTAPSRQLTRSAAPTSTKARTTSTGTGITAELQQVVDLVNAERAKAGCKALSVDSKLMTAAQRHSQDQADHRTMTHDGSDGSDVGERLDRVGYAWRAYGENVAWNQQSPAAVMDAWMNSPGHRANILNCSFTEIGVGVARSNGPYWTQDFGTPR